VQTRLTVAYNLSRTVTVQNELQLPTSSLVSLPLGCGLSAPT